MPSSSSFKSEVQIKKDAQSAGLHPFSHTAFTKTHVWWCFVALNNSPLPGQRARTDGITLVKYENKTWLIRMFPENKPNWLRKLGSNIYKIKPNRCEYILLFRSYSWTIFWPMYSLSHYLTLNGIYKHGFEKHALIDINKRSLLRERWVQAETRAIG